MIAMVMAYALALQAMLAAVIGTQHAIAASNSSDLAVICFGLGAAPPVGEEPPPSRIQQHLCVVCAVVCAPGALPVLLAFVFPPAVSIRVVHRSATATRLAVRFEIPRFSQGPPQTA